MYTTAKDLYRIDTTRKILVHVDGQDIVLQNGQRYKGERLTSIFNLGFDAHGVLWAAGASPTLSGLFHFDFKTNQWTFHAQPAYYDTAKKQTITLNFLAEPRSDSNNLSNQNLYIGRDNRIWLAGLEGIASYNPHNNRWQQYRCLVDSGQRFSAIVDNIIPLTDSTLLLSGSAGTFVLHTGDNYYKKNDINTVQNLTYGQALLQDDQHNIWFSDIRGLYKLHTGNNFFGEAGHIPGYVSAYLPIGANAYLYKKGSALFKVISNRIADSLPLPQPLYTRLAMAAAGEDKYYCVSNGLYAIDWKQHAIAPVPLRVVNSTLPLPSSFTAAVLVNDSILYAGRASMSQPNFMEINLKQHTLQYLTPPSKAVSRGNFFYNANTQLFLDSYGRIWITSHNAGVDVFYPQTKTFEHYEHIAGDSISFDNNLAPPIVETRDHRFFIGSINGIIEVVAKPGKPFVFKTIAPEVCFTMTAIEDTTGMMWIGHNNGIVKLNPADNSYRVYTAADGFRWTLTP